MFESFLVKHRCTVFKSFLYSIDLRKKVVKYKLARNTIKETSKIFGVGSTTISNWIRKYRRSGNLANKKLERKAKKLPEEELKNI